MQLHFPGIPEAQRTEWVTRCADEERSAMARREGESIYRRISTQMHIDAKVRALSRPPPNGRSLWEALLCGEQVDIVPGLFRIGEAAFADQLDWPIKGFRSAWAELEKAGLPVFADWGARLVWVVNALKYNMPASPKVVLHWRDCWNDRLPDCDLKEQARIHMKATLEAMGEPWGEAFAKATAKTTGIGYGRGYVISVSSKQLAVSSNDVDSSKSGESERRDSNNVNNSSPESHSSEGNPAFAEAVNNALDAAKAASLRAAEGHKP